VAVHLDSTSDFSVRVPNCTLHHRWLLRRLDCMERAMWILSLHLLQDLNSADVCNGRTNLLLIRLSLSSSVLFSTALWIYYAATSDVITTVAHLCAIILGIALAFFFDLSCPFPEYTPLEAS
jgi:hypothetical protein